MKKAFIVSIVVVLLLSLLSVVICTTPNAKAADLCPVDTPNTPSPTNSSTDISVNTTLAWDCVNASYYHVYFGTNSTPSILVGNRTVKNWDPLTPISYNTTYYWKIVAWDSCGNFSNSSIWNFTTECGNPGTPSGPVPNNLSTAVSVDADLDWSDCLYTTYYEVYFGNNSTPPLFNSSNTSNLTLPTLNSNTTYYWKIVAKNGCGGSTNGSLWSFTTACAVPGTPGNESPHDVSTMVSVGASLDWDNCSNATYYQVYFGINSSAMTLVGSPIVSNWTPPTLSSNTTYYWRVVAKNDCNGSTSSSIWRFTTECANLSTPVLVSPLDSSFGVSVNVDLDWGDCSGAAYYKVYCDTNPSPSTLKGDTTTSNLSLFSLVSNTKYYWKVVAYNGCGGSALGPIWNFTTVCVNPVAPASPFPSNNSTVASLDVDLNWSVCLYATYYQLYFGTNASTLELKATLLTNSWTPSPALTFNTTYYWKVIANNSCGSNSSAIWNFTTGVCTVPTKPQTPSPGNVSTNVSVPVTLDWADCANASSYDVYFGTSVVPVYRGNTSSSNYQVSGLNYSTKYYWQVVARNICGNNSSDVWNFTTGCPIPAKPQTPSPGNVSTNVSVPVTLDWADCANATSYDVYLSTSSAPSYHGNTSSSSYQVSQLNHSTKYYWQVVANNSCGNNSGAIWSFTTGVCPVPTKPQTPSPGNVSTNISVPVTLSWAPCAGATSYDVYLGTSSAPSYHGNTSNSSYQVSGLNYSTKYYWQVVAKNVCNNSSSNVWNFTTTTAPFTTVSFDIGGTKASWNISSNGVIQQAVNVTSIDEKIEVYIPSGTTALDDGQPLGELNMSITDEYPAPLGDRNIIAAFNFDPDGATFNPGIVVTLSYTHKMIPEGVEESSLIVAFYDESSSRWEYITDGVVNADANTITFTVNHFTVFAIQTPPVQHEGAGLAVWMIILIVFLNAIILGVAVGLYIKHRRIYGSFYYEDEGYVDDKYDEYIIPRKDEEDFKF